MKDAEKELLKTFQEERKFLLKQRIFDSVLAYKRRRRRRNFAWAASFALFIVASGYIYVAQQASFENEVYVNAIEKVQIDTSSNVSLILSDKQVSLAKEDSIISYVGKNNEILVGDSKVTENEIALNTVVVPFGRRTQLYLQDGTKVWLNAGSKLVYPSVFNQKKRTVYLEGEAAFDVAHDKQHPFIVKSKDQEIEVLGTVFNVSSYADEPQVKTALKSGSVQIHYHEDGLLAGKESVTIKPGTIASYNKEQLTMAVAEGDVTNSFLWIDGLIVFKNDDLTYIVNRLSRYYNVPIEVSNPDKKSITFSGYLDLKTTVEEVLDVISESASFSYTNEKGKIIIN